MEVIFHEIKILHTVRGNNKNIMTVMNRWKKIVVQF